MSKFKAQKGSKIGFKAVKISEINKARKKQVKFKTTKS